LPPLFNEQKPIDPLFNIQKSIGDRYSKTIDKTYNIKIKDIKSNMDRPLKIKNISLKNLIK